MRYHAERRGVRTFLDATDDPVLAVFRDELDVQEVATVERIKE